ncbi:Protein NETWORKED 2D [Linum grandiflorum]
MLQRAAGNAYSWWWASHIRTKQSKWLEQNLQDMEEKVHSVMTLVSEDGDSFAKRAEMYYKRRPEIIIFVEEAYRAYRALAERYDHISTELQNANNTIAYVFPEQVQFAMEEEDDIPSPRFLKKGGGSGDFPPKGNIPKVPKFSKEIKGMFHSATKKLQPKKSMKATVGTVSKSGLTKPEAFKEIEKLQKQVLGLQTEKEFVKSSYENGLSKYWEIDQQIREIQDKACTLQEEFGAETVIEDDEARSVMTTAALRSCQETLAKLEEKQEKSVEEAKIEKQRIREAMEKLKSLRTKDHRDQTDIDNDKFNPDVNHDSKATEEIELLREKIKKHFEASGETSYTVSEMAEKIDELVNKVVGLEAAVSSQSALIQRMRNETDELHGEIQSLDEEKGGVNLEDKLEEMERKLQAIQEINENVDDQSTNLQTNFMEAKCNLDHLYEKMDSVKPDEGDGHTPQPVLHKKKAPKMQSQQQQPFVKGKNIRNAVAEFDNSIKQEKEKSEKELKQQQVADEIRQAREARKKVKKPKREKKVKHEEVVTEKKEANVRTEEQKGYSTDEGRSDADASKVEETRPPKEQEEGKKERDDSEKGTQSDIRHGGDDHSENSAVAKQKSLKKLNRLDANEKVEKAESSTAMPNDSVQQGEERKEEEGSQNHSVEADDKSKQEMSSLLGNDLDKGMDSLEDTNKHKTVTQQQSLKKLEKLTVEAPEEAAAAAAEAVNVTAEPHAAGMDSSEDTNEDKTVTKQKSLRKLEKLTVEAPEEVAAAAAAAVNVTDQSHASSSGDAAAEAKEEADDSSAKTQEENRVISSPAAAAAADDGVKTEDDNAASKTGNEDDEPDWKELFLKGVENREQVLLSEYTTILRSYKEVKRKLMESEGKGGDSMFDITIQLRELKAANAKKDEQIRMLRKKLSQMQTENDDENADSPSSEDDILANINLELGDGISPIEERFRSSIDEVLEDNLDFWLRFSTTFQQVQQFETEVNDLQSELTELEEKLGKQDGSSRGKYSLKSDARPLYKHLREIHTELVVWIDKGMLLKDELKGRFSALCEIQDEITSALKESAEDEDFTFTSYQAAKFQGEILNMKQENTRVGDELQAGLDHVINLQLEVDKTLARLNEKFKLSGSKNRQTIQLQHTESRSRVPLRSFIFGVKQKKQRHSIFSVVHPVLHKKYNGLKSGLNL